jgi:hypothetical protein
MKTKKISKKLFLAKRTISDLNNREMDIAKGGVSGMGATCDPCSNTCYSCPRTCTSNVPKLCGTIGDLCP